MDKLIANFGKQLEEALEIGKKAVLTNHKHEIRNILVTGLGGSGIGGTLVNDLVNHQLKVPFNVNKEYTIPAYVNEYTMVIVSSYSGNTEETIHAMDMAMKAKAKIVCITSGGKILDIAKKNNIDHIIIPGGMPPRSCLGYSFVQQFFILEYHEFIDNKFITQLTNAIQLLEKENTYIKSEAKKVADALIGHYPIIYSSSEIEAVGIRLRQQLNENSKILCSHHVIPEMNHNELVGWRDKRDDVTVILLRNENDYERTQQRIEINKNIIKDFAANIIEIYSKGESNIERSIYLIHFGDWLSFYLAENRNVDAVEVNVIDKLKSELAGLN